jgi:flagellin-like protein
VRASALSEKKENKMKRNRSNKKAVSPVIAVLLMIAIAVAAAILVYVWAMGLIGTLTGSGGQQVKEQIILDAYNWKTANTMTVYMRNVGASQVIVDAVYVGGASATSNLNLALSLQTTASPIAVTLPGSSYTPGVAYTIKVITKTGGVFTFSVICGSAS